MDKMENKSALTPRNVFPRDESEKLTCYHPNLSVSHDGRPYQVRIKDDLSKLYRDYGRSRHSLTAICGSVCSSETMFGRVCFSHSQRINSRLMMGFSVKASAVYSFSSLLWWDYIIISRKCQGCGSFCHTAVTISPQCSAFYPFRMVNRFQSGAATKQHAIARVAKISQETITAVHPQVDRSHVVL